MNKIRIALIKFSVLFNFYLDVHLIEMIKNCSVNVRIKNTAK